jgi:hypothetical protein
MEPEVITGVGEFERTYGDGRPLEFAGGTIHNFLWHAVRAFFEEGGKRLYVSRTFLARQGSDGRARWVTPGGLAESDVVGITARWPGAAGNRRVRFTLKLGQNLLGLDPVTGNPTFSGLQDHDVVILSDPRTSPPAGELYIAESFFDPATSSTQWRFRDRVGASRTNVNPDADPDLSDQIKVITLMVTVFPASPEGTPQVWDGLSLDARHRSFGVEDSFAAKFSPSPLSRADARNLPIVLTPGQNLQTGLQVLDSLEAVAGTNRGISLIANLQQLSLPPRLRGGAPGPSEADLSLDFRLRNGDDGERPAHEEYRGTDRDTDSFKTGLKAFEDIEDISIVAAPGSTFGYEGGYRSSAASILNLLISHAERMKYRIAVLDSANGQTISDVRAMRARIDSKYAAFYYPWVRILDPITRREISIPPSGVVAGIYARNDISRAVYKAPANEVVNSAIGFEILLNKSQQDVLNPEGINCFRFFEGRGFRLWGARTVSSDPEWKYVNLRRYFIYLERSIDKGTQWAVFEPNGEALWANVRRTIEDFLLNEWQSGALLGDKPEKAYFVRCDRSTMTQNDLDNGRLICLIGVAALRPAEFVIFRIGQWTADRK